VNRPDWDSYFLAIAGTVSLRADCTRRRVGAVIVRNHRIISTGYNGAPAGMPGCLNGACPRGKHYEAYPVECEAFHCPPSMHEDCAWPRCAPKTPKSVCKCGNPWPCPDASLPGTDYSNCVAIHAEANAIIYASRQDCQGATIYITREPCPDCAKLIAGAGIIRTHFRSVNNIET